MRLHEYQGKQVFSRFGLSVPPGQITESPEEAKILAETIGLPVMLKSQVLVGGRGKSGGIRRADSIDEVEVLTSEILNLEIKGEKPEKVLIQKRVELKDEIYCGITIDRDMGVPVLILSPEGGMDIEQVAHTEPGRIVTQPLDPLQDPRSFEWMGLIKKIGLQRDLLVKVRDVVHALYRVFSDSNALLAEINPLGIGLDGQLYCIDAVLEIDDSALFRHPDLLKMKQEAMREGQERMQQKGSTFVPLGGNVGLICSGAGLAMATMDLIGEYPSLSPANFLETGGGITDELMADCLEVVLDQPGLKGVFINLYGGINPIHEGAKGIARVLGNRQIEIPIIAKALGNKEQETWRILEDAGVVTVKDPSTQKAVEYMAGLLGAGAGVSKS